MSLNTQTIRHISGHAKTHMHACRHTEQLFILMTYYWPAAFAGNRERRERERERERGRERGVGEKEKELAHALPPPNPLHFYFYFFSFPVSLFFTLIFFSVFFAPFWVNLLGQFAISFVVSRHAATTHWEEKKETNIVNFAFANIFLYVKSSWYCEQLFPK